MKTTFKVLWLLSLAACMVSTSYAQKRKSSSASQSYASRYSAIKQRLLPAFNSLNSDFDLAFRPSTPNMHMMDDLAESGFKLPMGDDPEIQMQVRKKMEFDYLKTNEGKQWAQKRSAMKKKIGKVVIQKMPAIRRELQRLSSLSPVPNSMRVADALITRYARAMGQSLDAMKHAAFNGGVGWDAAHDHMLNAKALMQSAESEMAKQVDLNQSNKTYVPG